MDHQLPALLTTASPWDGALDAFLVEKGHRSGSRRTVESHGRMSWPSFAELGQTPDRKEPDRRSQRARRGRLRMAACPSGPRPPR